MLRRFKNIKKIEKSKIMKEVEKIDYDKDGRAIIDVGLKSADNFFSPYSYRTQEIMNPEVDNYINDCESCLPTDKDLSIDIYTEEPVSNEVKSRIKKTVKRHHATEVIAIKQQLKRNLILGISFSVIGLMILLFEAVLYNLARVFYLNTVIGIVGWLFLWDGLEIIFYNRQELKRKLLQSYRLMNAKVHVRMYSKMIQREYGIGEYEEN